MAGDHDHTLTVRLQAATALLESAIGVMRPGYDEFDGKVRSLVHDLEWLRNRYVDRIRVENERSAA